MGSYWSIEEITENGKPIKREDTPIIEKKIWTTDDIVNELKSNPHFKTLNQIADEED